jgi:hypothetical protein
VAKKSKVVEIDCYEVRKELIEYMEDDLDPDFRGQIDHHLRNCEHCTAIYHGVRNVVELVGSSGAIELPEGFSRRLYKKLLACPR